jgi:hypothetical protein
MKDQRRQDKRIAPRRSEERRKKTKRWIPFYDEIKFRSGTSFFCKLE